MCQSSPLAPSGGTGSWEPINRNMFNDLGELTAKTLGCNLQTLDYAYTMRGWLNNINNPNDLVTGKDLFGMTLGYDNVGNITNQTYGTTFRKSKVSEPLLLETPEVMNYAYSYDNLNRILSGTLSKANTTIFALNGMSYDDNGNIKTLNRQWQGSTVDALTYSYTAGNMNRINTVSDAVLPPTGNTVKGFFDAPSTTYDYDNNGNTTKDTGKGITNMTYNYLNLVTNITQNNKTISYIYSSTGQKLKTTFGDGTKYDYLNNAVYKNDTLEFIGTAEGRFIPRKNQWVAEYHLKDHLGNLRVACACDTALKVNQIVHQDPWGLTLPIGLKGLNRFLVTGKEIQQETGYTDFGARQYDALVPHFLGVDPLSEKMPSWGSYVYVFNNPLRLIDTDGKYPRPILNYNSATGNYSFTKLATHLLSLVSGVSKETISNTVIQERKIGQYRPFYSSEDRGGAITVGTKDYKTITYTENFFADNKDDYKGNGFGRNIKTWLSLSAHEVGHLPQIDKEGGLVSYLGEFVKQYTKAGGHNDAEYEKDAEKGATNFNEFYNFVSSEYGGKSIENLFSNTKINESTKIDRITAWWESFQKKQKEQKNETK
jgi:RHS repeat-associated protein